MIQPQQKEENKPLLNINDNWIGKGCIT